jgi:threonylcarbamoyladenosine tRNA methylthiotransferase MtaB
MKVSFHTLGCKVNSYETEAVWELLERIGYQRVEFHEIADVVIINTCTVTNNGDAKSRKVIRQAVAQNRDAIVVVMGCFTQLKGDEVLSIDGVKIVLGTSGRHLIPDYIEEFLQEKKPLNKIQELKQKEEYEPLQIADFVAHQRAFLKIQDGCNNFCTFCIIPYARGRVRSKAPFMVLQEARQLVESGHSEIILTGIHTGGYGQDFPDYSFADLLKELTHIPGLKRIRISSIEISELTDDVVNVLSSNTLFCSHLHIPLQSGSETILKRMNRKYTKSEFADKIQQLRTIFPDIAITTDIIVGFPGETEADFIELMDFVSTIGFSQLHVFPYSKRSNTVAATMDDQIDGITKKERVHKLIALGEQMSRKYIQSFLGKTVEVIPEYYHEGVCKGHSDHYIQVSFEGDSSLIGQIVSVQLIEASYPVSKGKRV